MTTDKKLKANGTGKLLLGDNVVVDQNTDRLGVGTTSPAYLLDVKHSGEDFAALTTNSSTVSDGTGLYLRTTSEARISVGSNAKLAFYDNGPAGTENGSISGSGAWTLGPSSGLTSPHIIQAAVDRTSISNIGVENADLHIKNTRTSAAGERTTIRFDQGGIIKAMLAVKNVGGGTGSSFEFYTRDSGNVTKLGLEIGQTGAVTLGPSGGAAAFHTINQGIKNTLTSASGHIQLERTGTSSGSIYIGTGNGDFRVGTTAGATDVLVISSSGYTTIRGTLESASSYASTTATAANVNIDSSGVFRRSTSALKYKTDVTTLDYGLATVMQQQPVRYKSACQDDCTDSWHVGFVADWEEARVPELVQKNGEEVEGFSYERQTAILTKAIQEQQALIQDLQAKVQALEAAAP